MPENTLDNLIEAGWNVLKTNFDEVAIEKWRKEALDCVAELAGPDHPYTVYFKARADQNSKGGEIHAGGAGFFNTAKEQINPEEEPEVEFLQ